MLDVAKNIKMRSPLNHQTNSAQCHCNLRILSVVWFRVACFHGFYLQLKWCTERTIGGQFVFRGLIQRPLRYVHTHVLKWGPGPPGQIYCAILWQVPVLYGTMHFEFHRWCAIILVREYGDRIKSASSTAKNATGKAN